MLQNASVGAGNSKAGRKRSEVTLRKLRSAITNGSSVLTDIDHRSAWMRRLRDLIQLHLSDLGGDDNVSEAERSLVRRASMLELQCELLRAAATFFLPRARGPAAFRPRQPEDRWVIILDM